MKNKKEQKKEGDSGSQLEYWRTESAYTLSQNHPHRQLILDVLEQLEPFDSLLEVGCNIGQNLARIEKVYPDVQLAGVDVNYGALEKGISLHEAMIFKLGDAVELPFDDESVDILLYDACLMYVKDIKKAISEAKRVARKAIIILDWEAEKEILIGHSLARNYEKFFKRVTKIKITEDIWPNPKWAKYGQCFVAVVLSGTSTTN